MTALLLCPACSSWNSSSQSKMASSSGMRFQRMSAGKQSTMLQGGWRARVSYKELRAPRVYVPNKSFHDFEAATRFGEFVYLTQGRLPPKFNMNDVARRCQEVLQDAREFDYLLISGPHSVCSVATAILAYR